MFSVSRHRHARRDECRRAGIRKSGLNDESRYDHRNGASTPLYLHWSDSGSFCPVVSFTKGFNASNRIANRRIYTGSKRLDHLLGRAFLTVAVGPCRRDPHSYDYLPRTNGGFCFARLDAIEALSGRSATYVSSSVGITHNLEYGFKVAHYPIFLTSEILKHAAILYESASSHRTYRLASAFAVARPQKPKRCGSSESVPSPSVLELHCDGKATCGVC